MRKSEGEDIGPGGLTAGRLAGIGKKPRSPILAIADGQPQSMRVRKQTGKDGELGKIRNSKRNGFGDRLRPKNRNCLDPANNGATVCFPGLLSHGSRA